VAKVTAEISGDNYTMHKMCQAMGFDLKRDAEESTVSATLDLTKG
jgi:hypothetical protein